MKSIRRIAERFGKRQPEPPGQADRDRLNYGTLATQYYLLGRSGYQLGCFPVAGNLFHHAVELYLKEDIRQFYSRAELKRRFSHDLKRLWKEFKRRQATQALSNHDECVSALHRFERIRYPDAMTDKGMMGTIALRRSKPGERLVTMSGGPSVPEYAIAVNEVDHLIGDILTVTKLNPDFLFGRYGSDSLAVLHKDNPVFPSPP
jgi:hypothetical protein